MMDVQVYPEFIEVRGHASNKIACAMASALTTSLMKNLLERCNYQGSFILREGHFRLDTHNMRGVSQILTDAFIYSIQEFVHDYPYDGQFTDHRGMPTQKKRLSYAQ